MRAGTKRALPAAGTWPSRGRNREREGRQLAELDVVSADIQ